MSEEVIYKVKVSLDEPWTEVDRAGYVEWERKAGISGFLGFEDEPATFQFSNGAIKGRMEFHPSI